MDETPFYPFRTEIWCCVFPDDRECGFNVMAGDEAAWTLLLLTFSTGDVGQSLLISRTDSSSCKEGDLVNITSAPLCYAQSSSGSITDEIFDSYIDHLIDEYNPTIESPLYIQLDGHGSRSSWKNAERFAFKCTNNNLFCLFDPSAFSQLGQANDLGANYAFKDEYVQVSVTINEIDSMRALNDSTDAETKKKFLAKGRESIRQRSIEIVSTALCNMQRGRFKEIQRGYQMGCLQVSVHIHKIFLIILFVIVWLNYYAFQQDTILSLWISRSSGTLQHWGLGEMSRNYGENNDYLSRASIYCRKYLHAPRITNSLPDPSFNHS